MLEIVFIACLKLTPTDCSEKRLSFLARVDLAVCALHAQHHLAAWVRDHPAFTVTAWRCEDPSLRESDA
jgi:hypothetical protein